MQHYFRHITMIFECVTVKKCYLISIKFVSTCAQPKYCHNIEHRKNRKIRIKKDYECKNRPTEDKGGFCLGHLVLQRKVSTWCLWWWLSLKGRPVTWASAEKPQSGSGTLGCRRRLLWSSWTVWGHAHHQRAECHIEGRTGSPRSSRCPPLGLHKAWHIMVIAWLLLCWYLFITNITVLLCFISFK